jgi:FkbM family methyltransferase
MTVNLVSPESRKSNILRLPVRVSVVIATLNRSAGLRVVLDALQRQTFIDFEVVVVTGPSTDDTNQLLADRASSLRVVENPEPHLGKSRNLGVDSAAGEIVAFIDDDAVPEPRWIDDLVTAYSDSRVGGAGGLVYDTTGVRLQYQYAVCNRIGEPDFEPRAPLDDFNRVGADPCLYLQGTNMSYRREALEAVRGFDENLEYLYDDVDIAIQVIDAGWRLVALDAAPVHHKVLPSAIRRYRGEVTDPFTPVKDRTYFALWAGAGTRPAEELVRSLTGYLDLLRKNAADLARSGRFTEAERQYFVKRMEEGFEAGFVQGTTGSRAGRAVLPCDPETFKPYPVIRAPEDRMSVCFTSLDYPPKPMGGIARYTVELARGMAARGHDVHVVTESEVPYRLDFEDGVWVHRYPRNDRFMPSLDGHLLGYNLAHVGAVWRAVVDVAHRFPLDLVAGNVWLAEVLVCGLDPRWPTVMTTSTPLQTIAATQPALAVKAEVSWQVRMEHAALRTAGQLHAVSHAVYADIREQVPEANNVPAEVIWHGVSDRAQYVEKQQPHDGIEILFVGRLEPRKGIDTLLEASIQLIRERPGVRLRVVGADNPYASEDPRPYAERVRQRLASEPAVLAQIEFEGELSDATVDQLLQGCDIFCAPSRYESFGLMNVEAMMFSRPVVSTRVGGIPEVVVDDETGILVDPDDVGGLLRALRRLVDDPALARRLGRAGRARYETEFTNDTAVARMLDLFERTLHRIPGARISDADAESAVRHAYREVLKQLGGVENPDQAVAELLDPIAFPQDHLATVALLEHASDRDFVIGLYRSILQREPDANGLYTKVSHLASGGSRVDIVREIATSEEARLLGVDTRFLTRLAPGAVESRVSQLEAVSGLSQRLARAPGVQHARRIGRRVLRDPEVRGLRAKVDSLQQTLAGLLDARSRDVEMFSRLDAELRAVVAAELRAVIAETDRLGAELKNLPDELQRRAPRAGVYGTYIGEGRMLVGMVWGGLLLTPADDMSLTPELVSHGIYEPAFTHYLIRTLTPRQKVIDVGANIGMYTVLMAGLVGPSGKVTAYEPNPDILPYLSENVAVNWFNDRVDIRAAAASDISGRVPLYVAERFMGNSSLLAPDSSYFAHVPMDTVREVEVDVEPLDDAVELPDRVDLVKMDVEGAELRVMRGMTRLLAERRVDRVAFEVYSERMGPDWPEFGELLKAYASQGWRFHEIADDGALAEVSLETIIDVGRYSQVIMCAPELGPVDGL